MATLCMPWAMGWPSAFQIIIDWLEQPFLA